MVVDTYSIKYQELGKSLRYGVQAYFSLYKYNKYGLAQHKTTKIRVTTTEIQKSSNLITRVFHAIQNCPSELERINKNGQNEKCPRVNFSTNHENAFFGKAGADRV